MSVNKSKDALISQGAQPISLLLSKEEWERVQKSMKVCEDKQVEGWVGTKGLRKGRCFTSLFVHAAIESACDVFLEGGVD
jgi:hypothetical protein